MNPAGNLWHCLVAEVILAPTLCKLQLLHIKEFAGAQKLIPENT